MLGSWSWTYSVRSPLLYLLFITFHPQAAGLDPAHWHRRRHSRRRAEYIPRHSLHISPSYPPFGLLSTTSYPCHVGSCQLTTLPLSFHCHARTIVAWSHFYFLILLTTLVLQSITSCNYEVLAQLYKAGEGLFEGQAPSAALPFLLLCVISFSFLFLIPSALLLDDPTEPSSARKSCLRNHCLLSRFRSYCTRLARRCGQGSDRSVELVALPRHLRALQKQEGNGAMERDVIFFDG